MNKGTLGSLIRGNNGVHGGSRAIEEDVKAAIRK